MQKAVLDEGVLELALRYLRAQAAEAGSSSAAALPGEAGDETGPLALLRQASWLLSNLCRPRPQDDKLCVSFSEV